MGFTFLSLFTTFCFQSLTLKKVKMDDLDCLSVCLCVRLSVAGCISETSVKAIAMKVDTVTA